MIQCTVISVHTGRVKNDCERSENVERAGGGVDLIYYVLRSAKASYRAAKRGEIPTIKIGNRFRVPVAAMEARLAEAGRSNRPDQGDKVAA
jgi:hypothetical protein